MYVNVNVTCMWLLTNAHIQMVYVHHILSKEAQDNSNPLSTCVGMTGLVGMR